MLIIDQINNDMAGQKYMVKYIYKALFILANFATCNDYNLIIKLFQPEILEILKSFLSAFR